MYHYIELGYIGSLAPQHSEAIVSAHVRRNVLMYHGGAFAKMQGCTAADQQRHIQNMLPRICRSTQDQPEPLLQLQSSNHNYFFLSSSSCATTTSCSPLFLIIYDA